MRVTPVSAMTAWPIETVQFRERECSCCAALILVGQLARRWGRVRTVRPGPVEVSEGHFAHDLCFRTQVKDGGDRWRLLGVNDAGDHDRDLGATQWWDLLAPYGPNPHLARGRLAWWDYKPTRTGRGSDGPEWVEDVIVWPPELHSWIQSLTVPNWGASL